MLVLMLAPASTLELALMAATMLILGSTLAQGLMQELDSVRALALTLEPDLVEMQALESDSVSAEAVVSVVALALAAAAISAEVVVPAEALDPVLMQGPVARQAPQKTQARLDRKEHHLQLRHPGASPANQFLGVVIPPLRQIPLRTLLATPAPSCLLPLAHQ